MASLAEAEQQIRTALHRYCHTFDGGDFAAFAALFEHGRWFMVSRPGPQADPPVTTLAQARFVGTFTRHQGGWKWQEHTMEVDHAGDLGSHIRNGPPPSPRGGPNAA